MGYMETVQNETLDLHYSAKNSLKLVSFYCAAPEAESVKIAGDFNDWHPGPMQRTLDGWWFVRLQLCHGHHQYRFMVDGKPRLDPNATGMVYDERHEPACLIAVS
jgi:1,4-alpha-glucan branching enzyme